MGMVKEDPIGPLVRAIADEVERRIMPHLTQPKARLLSVEQAAAYLGRTQSAIHGMIQTGKLNPVRMDSRVMFDVQDLDRMIEASKNNS